MRHGTEARLTDKSNARHLARGRGRPIEIHDARVIIAHVRRLDVADRQRGAWISHGNRDAVEEPLCVARVFGDHTKLHIRAAKDRLTGRMDVDDRCREHGATEPNAAVKIHHVELVGRQGIHRRRVTEWLEWKSESALGESFFERGRKTRIPHFYLKENGCARADAREPSCAANPRSRKSRRMISKRRGRIGEWRKA